VCLHQANEIDTLREEYRLRMIQKRVPRRIYGPKKEEGIRR